MKELHRRSSAGFSIRLWYCLVMLFGMLIGWYQKARFSGLLNLSYVFYMLRRNRLAKKYNTERYIRIFRHIYNKWSILIIQYKSTLNLYYIHLHYMDILYCPNFYIYIYIYINAFLSSNVKKYSSTTIHLKYSYISILTNLLPTDNEAKSVIIIYNWIN